MSPLEAAIHDIRRAAAMNQGYAGSLERGALMPCHPIPYLP